MVELVELIELLKKTDRIYSEDNERWLVWSESGGWQVIIRERYKGWATFLYQGDDLIEALKILVGENDTLST